MLPSCFSSWETLIQIRLKVYYNNTINMRQRDWDQVQYLWTGMALKYGKQADADRQYNMELL